MFIYHKAEELTSENMGVNEGTCMIIYIPPNIVVDYNQASLSLCIWIIPGTGNND